MGARSKEKKARKLEARGFTSDGRNIVARSYARYIGVSPRKLALVADAIRGLSVGEAMDVLKYIHKPSASPHILKALQAAVANAEDHAAEPYELVVGEITVDGAPMIKRFRPASFGKGVRIRRRQSHLSIHLTNS